MTPPRAAIRTAVTAAASDSPGLSSTGIAFFGSLCAATFGLGCWQAQRYGEKIEMIGRRESELALSPAPLEPHAICSNEEVPDGALSKTREAFETKKSLDQVQQYRRVVVRGKFEHRREILVGPRGPPPGAIAKSGPNSGRSSGGMSSSPQGYYVITPFVRSDNMGTVLINRGWVPMQYVKQDVAWDKPRGILNIVGIRSKTETPRFLSPSHNAKESKKLIWMDRIAIEAITDTAGSSPLLLTETISHELPKPEEKDYHVTFPVKPGVSSVGEFKVMPSTHAGYAFTWFGLSGAGMIMTRKLITRGR